LPSESLTLRVFRDQLSAPLSKKRSRVSAGPKVAEIKSIEILVKRERAAMSKFKCLSILVGVAAFGVGAFVASTARADLIYAGTPMVSGGVGNSQIVLSLSSPGSTSNETGAVMPSGCTGNTQSPCKSPSNNTPTFSDAGVTGAQALVIYPDAAEPDNDNLITLNSLTLDVYNATGTSDTPLFSASYVGPPSPLNLTTCPGQGNNCVNAFVLDSTEAATLQAIFNPSDRVGLAASFSNATGGPDRLFLANSTDVPVPAPLIGHGLPALLAVGGILFGVNLLERSRKPSSLATDIHTQQHKTTQI
jgi:hypothetical protein